VEQGHVAGLERIAHQAIALDQAQAGALGSGDAGLGPGGGLASGGLKPGVNVANGKVTLKPVADATGHEYVPVEQALDWA
jgi:hypothetical protein